MNKPFKPEAFSSISAAELKAKMEEIWNVRGIEQINHLCRWSENRGVLSSSKGGKRGPVNKKAKPCAS